VTRQTKSQPHGIKVYETRSPRQSGGTRLHKQQSEHVRGRLNIPWPE